MCAITAGIRLSFEITASIRARGIVISACWLVFAITACTQLVFAITACCIRIGYSQLRLACGLYSQLRLVHSLYSQSRLVIILLEYLHLRSAYGLNIRNYGLHTACVDNPVYCSPILYTPPVVIHIHGSRSILSYPPNFWKWSLMAWNDTDKPPAPCLQQRSLQMP